MMNEGNNFESRESIQKIPLSDIYKYLVESFPNHEHNEDTFISSLLTILSKDPIRNRGLKRDIENSGMNFMILSIYPLNDFLYASRDYLLSIGIRKKEVIKFTDNMIMERDTLFFTVKSEKK